MKSLNKYNLTELTSIQMKDYSGGLKWWVAGIITYVIGETIAGIDAAYQRGCFKQE